MSATTNNFLTVFPSSTTYHYYLPIVYLQQFETGETIIFCDRRISKVMTTKYVQRNGDLQKGLVF